MFKQNAIQLEFLRELLEAYRHSRQLALSLVKIAKIILISLVKSLRNIFYLFFSSSIPLRQVGENQYEEAKASPSWPPPNYQNLSLF